MNWAKSQSNMCHLAAFAADELRGQIQAVVLWAIRILSCRLVMAHEMDKDNFFSGLENYLPQRINLEQFTATRRPPSTLATQQPRQLLPLPRASTAKSRQLHPIQKTAMGPASLPQVWPL